MNFDNFKKELSLCHKLWFSNPNIFGTHCRKPLIFQTYIFRSNKSHSLKFQIFTKLESKDIGIRKLEFVAKSQFLYIIVSYNQNISLIIFVKIDSMPGSDIRLVFTLPARDSTCSTKNAYTSVITFFALVPWFPYS